MPAFPVTISIPESYDTLDPGFLDSVEDHFKSSTQNTVPIQQPQDSEEATKRDETDGEGSAHEIHSPPHATPSFRRRFFHSLLPSAAPSAALSGYHRGGVLSDAYRETTLSEGPEAASKETAANVPQPVLRKAGPRRNRDRFQSRMQIPYQQSGHIQSSVNLVTQQETSSIVDPITANFPSNKPAQLYGRHTNSYGRCPPPPHSDKGWVDHCLSEKYNKASTKFALLPMKDLREGISLSEYILLVFGVLICFAGIILWLYGVIHSIRYIRKNCVTPQRSRQYQGRPLLPQIYGRKFSKSRPRKGISEGWRNDGQKNEEVIWHEEQENVSLLTNNYSCYEGDEESTIYEMNLSDTEKDYDSRYGKPVGRVLYDGLVGSMKGGTWLRKILGSSNSSGRSWKEAIMVQSAPIHSRQPTIENTRQQQPLTDGNASNWVAGYSDTLGQVGLSDSIRSASGVDMNWERGEVTLSFRRDALLRRAMRANKNRMDCGDLGIHARSATFSIRGAEENHIPARIHET
ncbi:hypothetical protein EV426DRAFT_639537 [Tirmania nivea]|nr:hypothetical protein EV426DRAFT_639537 [Tirmania nivea]